MSVVKVTNQNFKEKVLSAGQPVVVDFYADWCAPCKTIGPVIDELANDYDGRATICKLNIDTAQDLASEYGVMSIPTIIVFKSGEKKEQVVGVASKKQIESLINKHI